MAIAWPEIKMRTERMSPAGESNAAERPFRPSFQKLPVLDAAQEGFKRHPVRIVADSHFELIAQTMGRNDEQLLIRVQLSACPRP
ncbi:hypothetical protein HNP33_000293 [Comamonas odontotermitis]|uniref:Uncharacterized protein n=1 Tax=Comamonas odontotermitis TaxID=379895 RepID=A0ABR6RAR1_9BURK|nr:hypothetical protein [Comamonas odontotermitis]